MALIQHTSSDAGPFYAFPLSQAPSFANWASKRVQLTGSAGYFSGTVDTVTEGNVWLIFSGSSQPANFDAWIAKADFSTETAVAAVQTDVDSLQTSMTSVPKYGETQRWANPTETIDVSITKVT